MRPRFMDWLEPWLGSLAALVVPGYAAMLALGALLGAAVVVDRARREHGFARSDTLGVLVVVYGAGLVGAWAVPAGQAVVAWLEGGRLAAPTGMAAYGGLVGGTLGAFVELRRRAMHAARFLDAGAPAVALGVFFARIGCFLAGCDYGRPTSAGFGVTFPPGSPAFRDHVARGLVAPDAAASLAVHPTELYEAAVGLALFFALPLVGAKRPGARFASLVVAYAGARAVIEAFRGDASRGHLGALSTAQVFAVVTSATALALFVRGARAGGARAAGEAVS